MEYYIVSKPCLTSLFSPQSEKNAFFVADLGVIMRQQVRWRTHLPQIRPYFPVRCNNSPTVIEILAAFGTGFVCTNKVRTHGIDCVHQNSHDRWKKSILFNVPRQLKVLLHSTCQAQGGVNAAIDCVCATLAQEHNGAQQAECHARVEFGALMSHLKH